MDAKPIKTKRIRFMDKVLTLSPRQILWHKEGRDSTAGMRSRSQRVEYLAVVFWKFPAKFLSEPRLRRPVDSARRGQCHHRFTPELLKCLGHLVHLPSPPLPVDHHPPHHVVRELLP